MVETIFLLFVLLNVKWNSSAVRLFMSNMLLSYISLMLSQFEKDFGVREDREEQGSNDKNKCSAVGNDPRIQGIYKTNYNYKQQEANNKATNSS